MQEASLKPSESDEVGVPGRIDTSTVALLSSGQEEESLIVARGVLRAGLFIPLHSHMDLECLYVETGEIDVFLGDGGQWFTVRAGENITVQSDVPHAIRNVSGVYAIVLVIMTVKLARFLKDLDNVMEGGTGTKSQSERIRELAALGERYGYWLARPAESEAIRRRAVGSKAID